MYLKQTKTPNGRVYVSITQSFRDEDGKPRNRTVRSLGYLDEIEAQHPNALEWCMSVKEQLERDQQESRLDHTLSITPATKLEPGRTVRKNLGFLAFRSVMRDLALEQFFRSKAGAKTSAGDPYKIFSCMLYTYLLHERSWRSVWERRSNYFEPLDFTLNEMFQSVEFIGRHSKDIRQWVARRMDQTDAQRNSIAFLPVVNFFFEDTPESADLDVADAQKGSVFRQFDPIVQVALLVDANQLPIDYEVFFGRDFEQRVKEHIRPDSLIDAFMERHDFLERIVIVADKGAIASDDVVHSITKSGGYVFGQSPYSCEPQTLSWIASPEGYSTDKLLAYREKDRVVTRRITFGNEAHLSKRIVPEKQLALWSRTQQGWERAQRASTAATLFEIGDYTTIEVPSRVYRGNAAWTAQGIAADYAEVQDGLQSNDLAFIDGYKMLVTSETQSTNRQIVAVYQLLKTARAMFASPVSDMKTLPKNVSREAAARAHCVLCFTASAILEQLRARTGYRFATADIAKSLASMNGTEIENGWYVFDYTDPIVADLGDALDAGFDRKYLSQSDISRLLRGRGKKPAG